MNRTSMRRRALRWLLLVLAALALLGVIWMAWRPNPIDVEIATVSRGPLVVTVDEDGLTRVKDRYLVSAPIAGNLGRLELDAGDPIAEGQVLARLVPLPPPLLDARTRAEAEARVAAARAARRQSQAAVNQARHASDFAKKEADRALAVVEQGGLAASDADRAVSTLDRSLDELRSAEFGARVAEHQLELAETALTRLSGTADDGEQVEISSPVDGQVLRVLQESEGVVQAGAPIIEVGNPGALEVVVDVLSQDATRISPNAPVVIERWGGARPLEAHVRRVEPSAFTKISALGVEEQRVNVIVDIDEPKEHWSSLGDGFRVEARISIWRGDDVLRVPASAVFRAQDSWASFVVEDGKAVTRPVEIGETSGLQTEVLSGLEEGEQVIAYPSDSVRDGVPVRSR
jgi:HlyD family secretion protein